MGSALLCPGPFCALGRLDVRVSNVSLHGVNEWTKPRETYGVQAAILFGGDHLGGAPESLARPILVFSVPPRGRRNLISMRSDLSIKAYPAVDG